jgi:hypothetical protein
VGPKGGLGEHGDSVSRQLVLTKFSIVERRPDNYEVAYIHPTLFWTLFGIMLHLHFAALFSFFIFFFLFLFLVF